MRNGTANIFCIVEPKTGKRLTYATRRRTNRDFDGSWLNAAEMEASLVGRQCLGKRPDPDLTTLRREVRR